MIKQSELNIGTLGHVDHGKTTLTAALTHMWTDKHSESIKRSMTIKLGYADATIRKCHSSSIYPFTTDTKCPDGSTPTEILRKISLLDAPGHETLMATAIAGSNIIDAALFVISAAEPCPMPQTREHLMLINALGIKDVIIVQTKIDVVGKEKAKKHYEQIKQFIKGSKISEAPIIPVMANKNINIDALLDEILRIKIPERDLEADPILYIARSFDVNKPGTPIKDLVGGVIGGSVIRGRFKLGDKVAIRPGINTAKDKQKRENFAELVTKIESLAAGSERLESAMPGGLIAVGTTIDPSMTKADGLVGQIMGHVGKLPDSSNTITINYTSLERNDLPKQAFKADEIVLLGIGTGTVVGFVTKVKKNKLEIGTKHTVCVDKAEKVSVLRNYGQRWKLSGFGTLA